MRSAVPFSAEGSGRGRVWLRLAAALLALAILVPDLIHALRFVSTPGRVTGWEAAWIAKGIAEGHGFSLPEAGKFFGRPRGLDGEGSQKFHRLKPLAPNDASALYLRTFRRLA